jgi:hypothetical protein
MNKKTALKRDLVLNCISSGLSIERAFVYAQCTPEEIEELESDKEFLSVASFQDVNMELELLNLHTKAMEESARRGNASAVQWRLERLYPSRWGAKQIALPIGLGNPEDITQETANGMSEKELLDALAMLEKKDNGES